MSRTIARLPYQRFVRRATSGQVTNTQWLGALAGVRDDLMAAAPWQESAEAKALLPVNVPTTPDFGGDAYDAYKQSGAAEPGTGTQAIFAGMAAYRIPIPAGAMTGHVAGVRFGASADKFCVGGLKVSVVLSDSATPPVDWAMIRQGGCNDTPDETGEFATVGAVDDHGAEVLGILAETSATIAAARNQAGVFELDLSGNDTAYNYLYLIVSLYDYGTWRREYWVEGSGAIDGASIAVTFSGDITIPDPPVPVVMAARQVGASTRVTFSDSNYNLTSGYLQLHWGARMLLSGFADPASISANGANQALDTHLAPRVTIAGGTSTARAEYVEAYSAEPLVAGNMLWIRAAESPEGAARVRVTVIASDDAPDVTSGAMWDGSAADVIGTALTFPQAGEWVGIPITKNATTRKLQIVACVAEVPAADAEAIAVGFPNIGFDLANMHISASPAVPAAGALPASGIHVMSPNTLYSGNIFRGINSGLPVSNPLADRGKIGLTSTASACIYGTSYGAWQNLDGSPAAPFSGTYSHLAVWSGKGYFLALDNYARKWYKAGSLPVALAALTDTTTSAVLDRIVVDGGAVAWVDAAAPGCKTAGEAGAWKTAVEAWTDAMIIAKAGNITVAICDNGGTGTLVRAYTMENSNGAMKTALEAVVDAYDVVVDFDGMYHRVIFRMIDGTVKAYRWFMKVTEETATATWSGVTDVGIAAGLFWAISGNALLCSGTAPSWADDSALPATATRTMLLSGTDRLGIAYK